MLWPPNWSNTYQAKNDWPHGEIGTLESVWMDKLLDRCVFLYVKNDVFHYTGRVLKLGRVIQVVAMRGPQCARCDNSD